MKVGSLIHSISLHWNFLFISMEASKEKSVYKGECGGRIDLNGPADRPNFLLRGGRAHYENTKFSDAQLESLTALCDTLIPSIDLNGPENNELKSFYGVAASHVGVPEHLAGYMSHRLVHAALCLLKLCLWLLSTWYGTFLLCGRLSLSSHFPYFQRFSQVLQHEKEQILLSWSHNSWYIFRMLFNAVKFLCCLSFYTKVDEQNESPSWKAMGYCGPDPRLSINSKETKSSCNGPLRDKVIAMDSTEPDNIPHLLRNAGCEVVQGISDVQSVWKQRSRNHNKNKDDAITIKCDVVVVGSGSGGGVVAGVIAQAGYKVIVLEKGKYFARDELSLLEGPSLDQMYEGGGLLATDDLGIVLLAGSTVGGGSCVNWSASLRTPVDVITEWSNKLKLKHFSSELYTEAMEIVCRRMGVQEEICNEGFMNQILRKGCEKLMYPVHNIPRNANSDHFCGWCGFGCKDGKKKGTQETWLVDAANSGAVILSDCRAVEVIHEKNENPGSRPKKAVGVLFRIGNRTQNFFIESKATVISCGALCSPKLLKKSGLKNPNIGRNLHLHPVQMAWGYFPESEWPPGKSFEGGIMTTMSIIPDPSGYGAVIQTPSLHPGMFAVMMPWISSLDMKERMTRFSRTAHLFALARDKGSGTVNHPGHLNYSLNSHDENNLRKGIESILRILVAAGAQEVGTHHCYGERLILKDCSPEEVERFIERVSSRKLRDLSTPLCSAHQMGSCRMGVDERSSAVDERGETWEVEGLFVADASVLPTAVGVNPMVTVQSVAYCTANFLLETLRGRDK